MSKLPHGRRRPFLRAIAIQAALLIDPHAGVRVLVAGSPSGKSRPDLANEPGGFPSGKSRPDLVNKPGGLPIGCYCNGCAAQIWTPARAERCALAQPRWHRASQH